MLRDQSIGNTLIVQIHFLLKSYTNHPDVIVVTNQWLSNSLLAKLPVSVQLNWTTVHYINAGLSKGFLDGDIEEKQKEEKTIDSYALRTIYN